ncbi:MAG: diphthine synthase [Candidatus Pacearchaeota archaeon]
MFYLIGLGMNLKSISVDALEILKGCDEIYLENYTVNFPYKISELKKSLDVNIKELGRGGVEDESLLKDAKKKNVALLVYGDVLSATTHIQLIISCKKQKIPYEIFHNASILTVVAETGLSLYKFGKIASMPDWKEHTNKPMSFMNYVKENLSIKAHTLLLTDIGLEIKDVIEQLEESMGESLGLPEKIIVVSNAGTEKQKIFYGLFDKLKCKKIEVPFCVIIPSELHFLEKEVLEEVREKI